MTSPHEESQARSWFSCYQANTESACKINNSLLNMRANDGRMLAWVCGFALPLLGDYPKKADASM